MSKSNKNSIVVKAKKSDLDVCVKDDMFDIDTDNNFEIAKGFDRGIDYLPIKDTFIKEYNKIYQSLQNIDTVNLRKISMLKKKLVYILVAMIQLRNASRISEACHAIKYFCTKDNYKDKIIVKIAKSEAIKYKQGQQIITKPRYRKMIFPGDWLNNFDADIIKDVMCSVPFNRLKKRVLDYLLKYHKCNTHSLRYACINYLVYEMNRPLNDVAKFVGHVDLSMLTKYTQQKNCEKIFELDM